MKDIRPLRICEHCGFLGVEGYEYPEEYCMAGVADDDPLMCEDKHGNMGCIYTNRQLKIRQEHIDEMQAKEYADMADWYAKEQREKYEAPKTDGEEEDIPFLEPILNRKREE